MGDQVDTVKFLLQAGAVPSHDIVQGYGAGSTAVELAADHSLRSLMLILEVVDERTPMRKNLLVQDIRQEKQYEMLEDPVRLLRVIVRKFPHHFFEYCDGLDVTFMQHQFMTKGDLLRALITKHAQLMTAVHLEAMRSAQGIMAALAMCLLRRNIHIHSDILSVVQSFILDWKDLKQPLR